MTEINEQRAHQRAPLEVEVSLESDHNFYTGLTSDISEGGIFVATHVLPRISERLEMTLTLPGSATSFVLRGVVCWVRELRVAVDGCPPGFGMQWEALSQEATAAIQAFIEKRDSIFYDAA